MRTPVSRIYTLHVHDRLSRRWVYLYSVKCDMPYAHVFQGLRGRNTWTNLAGEGVPRWWERGPRMREWDPKCQRENQDSEKNVKSWSSLLHLESHSLTLGFHYGNIGTSSIQVGSALLFLNKCAIGIVKIFTMPKFNSCTKCVGILGTIHDRTSNCHLVF